MFIYRRQVSLCKKTGLLTPLKNFYSNNFLNRKSNLLNIKFNNLTTSSDNNKTTLVARITKFSADLLRDYKEVVKDVIVEVKEKPRKAATIATTLGLLFYCGKLNPDEISFRTNVLNCIHDIMLIGKPVRNPASEQHLIFLETCYNQGLLRRFSFGIFSVIWLDNYNSNLGLYKTSVPYLKPKITTYWDRIIDIGFLNKWWILNNKMIDYDVNPSE
uniref:Mitochondrial import inner membrane translocase subunit Tim29 n=1 Tax=Clastoptera arizonana TaxID=38151 RepID=A0A1B6BXL3_9HEMI